MRTEGSLSRLLLLLLLLLFFFSLSSLPSGRSRRPTAPLLPVLSFFLEFTVSLRHHPVQYFLPWSSSSSLPLHLSLHYFSLKRVSSQQVSHTFLCLALIVDIRELSSPTNVNTSSFDICSVQLILSILRHTHISKASSLATCMSTCLIVHVSAQ